MPLLFVFTICSSAVPAGEQFAGQPVKDQASNVLAPFIVEASRRFAVPVRWVSSVIRLESVGDVRAKSPKGAMGLMQIMPGTWYWQRSLRRSRQHFGWHGVSS
ncbi:transglycosylase SLT domain-containing protein [Bradyrhizobium sp. CCGUVB23]|uniref:transglycosylase SLT domain-containing protein n=1 Tax=Bradyrhizobium sp. CCGUVB23 TaxID=2949630 RepID=UPI0035325CFF